MAVMHTCRSFACSNRSGMVTCRHGEISRLRQPLAAMAAPLHLYDLWTSRLLVAFANNTASGNGEASAMVRQIPALAILGDFRAIDSVADQSPLVFHSLL